MRHSNNMDKLRSIAKSISKTFEKEGHSNYDESVRVINQFLYIQINFNKPIYSEDYTLRSQKVIKSFMYNEFELMDDIFLHQKNNKSLRILFKIEKRDEVIESLNNYFKSSETVHKFNL